MYSKNQIKEALDNNFIQVKVTTNKGLEFINSVVGSYNQAPFRDYGVMYFFRQDFGEEGFGLNGNSDKKEGLTVIEDKKINNL